MSKKRTYDESYLNYGFTFLIKDGLQVPQFVICFKTFSNGCMKPFQLKQHKNHEFFLLKATSLKRAKLDSIGSFQQHFTAVVKASYAISLQIAKAKKPHTIGESLIKRCILECANLVLGVKASEELKQISLSNDTIKSRFGAMSSSIKDKVIMKAKRSPFFAIQLDESTDVQNLSQLLVLIRFIGKGKIEEEFLFCRPLDGTTKGEDVKNAVETFFKENGLTWDNLVGVCTDGAPAMLGSRSGFISLVKHRNPNVKGVHCLMHKEALASKTLPKNFNRQLQSIIKVVNYIKGSALNTRLFRKLCDTMEAKHCDLLFYIQVRWLSKGNMVKRVFELLTELENMICCQILMRKDFRSVLHISRTYLRR